MASNLVYQGDSVDMVTNDSSAKPTIPCQILVTHRSKYNIRKGLKLGEQFCCHPYTWDEAKGYPMFTKSRIQIIGWVFNIVVSVAYFIFLLLQCIRICTSTEETTATKAFLMFAVILFSFPVFFQANILVAGEDLANYVRNYFTYCHDFEDKYVRETAKPSTTAKIGGMVLSYVYYAIPLDMVLLGVYGIIWRDSPEQASSLITGYPAIQIPMCVLFCVYYYSCFAANALLMIFTPFGALFASFDVFKELGKKETNFTTEAFQRPQDRIRAYRVIQLQADATDRVYWVVTIAAQYVLMLLAMICTYGAIRWDGLVAIVLEVLGGSTFIILMVFLNAWAEFYTGSSNALLSLNAMTTRADVVANAKFRAWLRKSVRSLRVARLPVCGSYYIDKELVLSVISIISNGIIFLLVNF